MTPLISRRTTLGLPALLALGSIEGMGQAPIPAAPCRHPDHDLLTLARRHASHDRRMNRLIDLQCEAENAGDDARYERLFQAQLRFVDYGHELDARVAAHPARTLEGMQAKARAVLTKVQFMSDGAPHFDDALAWSLALDVLGGSGR